MRQKHVGLKRQFSAGVSLSSLESHVLPANQAQMPDSCDFDGARAVEALRVVSVSIRHGNLGAESRKERAGSDREVWSAPGISQEALPQRHRDVKGAKGAFRTVRYAFVQLRLKPARFL